MAKKYSDQEILDIMEKPNARQREVFEFLSDFYDPIIVNFARRHGVPELYIEDVVSETLAVLFINLSNHKIQLAPSLNAYISRVYLNKTLNYTVRSGKVLQNTIFSIQNSEDSDILQYMSPATDIKSDPFDILWQKELQILMHQAINQLEQKCVTIFNLLLDDLSLKEIGEQLKNDGLLTANSNLEDATKSQKQRCKNKLKAIIETSFPELINYYKK